MDECGDDANPFCFVVVVVRWCDLSGSSWYHDVVWLDGWLFIPMAIAS